MKHFFLKLLFFCFILFKSCFSSAIDLSGTWLFKTGDAVEWANLDYADSTWDFICAPQIWETAGFHSYNGYAWYRKTVTIPESWQHEKYFEVERFLILELGNIGDVDQTFFNGKVIGTTGDFPPHFKAEFDEIRKYRVPAEYVRWGEKNLIAIRVYDSEGYGGIQSGTLSIKTPTLLNYCDIKIDLNHPNHIYQSKEPIVATTSIANPTIDAWEGEVEWQIISDLGNTNFCKTQSLRIPKADSIILTSYFQPQQPGFFQVQASLRSVQEIFYQKKISLGIELKNLTTRPFVKKDFYSFWTRTKEQLDLTPVQPISEVIDSLSSTERKVYSLRLLSFNNVYIYGKISIPLQLPKFPAILYFPGNHPLPIQKLEQLFPDFAILSFQVRGFGESADEINPGNPGYIVWNINNKEKYIIRGAVMDCIRAVDFLYSIDRIDTSRIAAFATDLNGAFAVASAGLDSRIKMVAANEPLLIDFPFATKTSYSSFYEIVQYIIEHPPEKKLVFQNLSYFDLLNFVDLIKCPIFLGASLESVSTPARTIVELFNALNSEKDIRLYIEQDKKVIMENYLLDFSNWLYSKWKFQKNNSGMNSFF